MKRALIYSAVALSLIGGAVEAKEKKKESEVQKALKEQYPDAQTQITATNEINGVKVYDVAVTTKEGQSTAQITDYGDFLMYGMPHEYGAIKNLIASNVSGLFKATPDDIDMYRVTNYSVEFAGPKGKNYSARFDALGQLKDIYNTDEIKRESGQNAHGGKANADQTKKAEAYVKKYAPDTKVQSVYQADQGEGFLYVQTTGGEWILNPSGQVYSFREEIKMADLPDPVEQGIKNTFSAQPTKAFRGEYEYYQFSQKSQTGEPIIVKMRPNGDILSVNNDKARQQEEALQAKHKSKSPSPAKKG